MYRSRSWHHAHVQSLRWIAVLLLFVAACGDDAAPIATPGVVTTVAEDLTCDVGQADGDLFVYSRIDYVAPELVEAFESEFGVDVIEDVYESSESIFAKLQSGASYDFVVAPDHTITRLVSEGLLGKIQTDALPNLLNLRTRFSDPPYDPGGTHSVAYMWGTVGLGAADASGVVGPESSWALVFEPDTVSGYAAGISLLEDPRHTIGAALKYLGYSLNSTNPDELREASDLLSDLGDLSVTFDSDNYDQRAAGGGVSIAHGFSDRFDIEGVGFTTPTEGAALWVSAMAVPANAEHPCTAHTFINYLLEAENGGTLATWTGEASPNRAALPFVDPELLEDRSIYPGQDVDRRLEFIEDLGDFEEEYSRALAIARG